MSAAVLVRQTFSRWNDHEGQRLGAALAFYALLSSAPLLVFLLLAVSALYGQPAVQEKIIYVTRVVMGATAATVAQNLLISAHQPSHTILTETVAVFTLLFGASSVFSELRDDLNTMWDARIRRRGILGIALQRAFSFLLVL